MAEKTVREVPQGLRGTYYEGVVPDTLNLAKRAKLGLNHYTETIQESLSYEMYFGGGFREDGSVGMGSNPTALGACQAKCMEAMAMLRIMSGSRQHLKREAKMVEMMVSLLEKDGLHWVPGDRWIKEKPWLRIPEPFVMVHGQGRMMRAMIAWYQYTGDSAWKERIDRMVDGMDRFLVVHKDSYAYVPVYGYYEQEYLRSCYTKKGWKNTVEPSDEKFGEEGSLFNHQGHIPGALANWYLLTGNEQALRLSEELVRFYIKPKFWADWEKGEYPGVVGTEHAHWRGHFHGHINTLRAILEYAIAANDARLKNFVRDGYEWARQSWLARIGYVGDGQGCGLGRLIGLAVKLSDAGVGDYWEDVDQYIRNHAAEYQFTPEDILHKQKVEIPSDTESKLTPEDVIRRLEEEGKLPPVNQPDMTSADFIRATIGAISADPFKNGWGLCCTSHGNMGFFYAWDGTLRYSDGLVRVNLLLNRASPWMDVDSYLPYQGKVVIKNKTAQEAFVRIPLWVDKKAVSCQNGKRGVPANWFGNYLRFEGLTSGDVLTIEFPMVEKTEKYTTPGKLRGEWPGWEDNIIRTFKFRGNTLIEMSNPILPGSPLYLNRVDKYKTTKTPMKKATRFVSPIVIEW